MKIQISDQGKRCGESHGRAKLTDHEVDLIFELREGGMSAKEIAVKFDISKRYVYKLLNHERRNAIVVKVRDK